MLDDMVYQGNRLLGGSGVLEQNRSSGVVQVSRWLMEHIHVETFLPSLIHLFSLISRGLINHRDRLSGCRQNTVLLHALICTTG